MIDDLSQSLRKLLMRPANGLPALAGANVVFDRPADAFSPSQPTISLFLFDVRENTELRSNDSTIERRDGFAVITRAPIRIATSYLVTAWSGKTGEQALLDEQLLLSQALMVFSRFRSLPVDCLSGALVGQQPDLPMITAQAEGVKNPAEFWTALNNKLRPSLAVVITFSMPVSQPETAPLAISSEIMLKTDGVLRDDRYLIGGRVLNAASAVVANAAVSLDELGLSATTDSEGRYVIGRVVAGTYALKVSVGGGTPSSFSIKVPPDIRTPPPKTGERFAYDMQLM